MAVSAAREAERKYEAAEGALVPEQVGDGYTVEAAAELHLVATYYDTPGLRMLRNGATLRHRTGEGAAHGWHLKLPAGVDARQELHVVGDPDEVPGGAARAGPRPHRSRRAGGRRRAAHDPVGAGGGRRSRPRSPKLDDDAVDGRRLADGLEVAWRELEAELYPGTADALLDELGAALGSAGWQPAAGREQGRSGADRRRRSA